MFLFLQKVSFEDFGESMKLSHFTVAVLAHVVLLCLLIRAEYMYCINCLNVNTFRGSN